MKKYINILVIIILIFFFFHIKQNFKINNDIDILQVHNPDIFKLKESLYNKSPTIITGVMENWEFITKWSFDYLIKYHGNSKISKITINDKDITKFKKQDYILTNLLQELSNNTKNVYGITKYFGNEKIKDKINEYIKKLLGFNIAMTNFKFILGNRESIYHIKSDTNDYIMLGQIYGTSRILLWNPEQRKNMYPSDLFDLDGCISKINFKNIKKEFYNFNKSKYVEIILNPGQIISIPPYWWYYVDSLNKNIILQLNIDSYLSYSIKLLFEKWTSYLHLLNIHKNQNCLCCTK